MTKITKLFDNFSIQNLTRANYMITFVVRMENYYSKISEDRVRLPSTVRLLFTRFHPLQQELLKRTALIEMMLGDSTDIAVTQCLMGRSTRNEPGLHRPSACVGKDSPGR